MAKKNKQMKTLLLLGGGALLLYYFVGNPASAAVPPLSVPGTAPALPDPGIVAPANLLPGINQTDQQAVTSWIQAEPNASNRANMIAFANTLTADQVHLLAEYYNYFSNGYKGPVPAEAANFLIANPGHGFHQ